MCARKLGVGERRLDDGAGDTAEGLRTPRGACDDRVGCDRTSMILRTYVSSSPTRTCSSTTSGTYRTRSRWTGSRTSTTPSRDYLDPEHFANLMSEKGITPETTVVFYGDKNNWWATYALWVFRLFGHDNVRVMDGGRVKWEAEGRSMTQEVPSFGGPTTRCRRDDEKIRAFEEE